LSDSWVLLGVILVASLIQGTAGFGFGLFSMGILAVIMPVTDAAVIVAILGLVTTTLNVWTVRRDIPWKELWPVVAAAVPTTALGVYLLKTLDAQVLRAAVAAMIFAGCAVTLWSPHKTRLHKAMPWAYLSGAVGGVFGGAINMGGPPVVVYCLLRGWDKSVAKAVMSSYFFATSIIRVAGQVASGIATSALIRQSLLLTIPTLLACYFGTWLFVRMSNRVFRYAATAILVGLAIRLLLS
jgi:hypothetical protein